jgi:hypothetical protein
MRRGNGVVNLFARGAIGMSNDVAGKLVNDREGVDTVNPVAANQQAGSAQRFVGNR